MTVPNERYQAVIWTYDFMRDLLDPKKTPRVPRDIRRRAASLLKHYPSKWEMEQARESSPSLFGTWKGKRP